VRTRGWTDGSGRDLIDLVIAYSGGPVAALVVTDIGRDGTLDGPDLAGLARVIAVTDRPLIVSGGVAALDHLRAIADLGAAGVIVGTALYEGHFTVEEAVAACGR
jgi:phosphoribosylformimino-5-aminoimidazole carboxamide ribonucleotide (ProFAR) isomerase